MGTLGAIGEVDHRACIFDAPDIGRFGASFSLGPATTFFMWVRPAAGLAAFPIGTGGSPEVFANAFTVTRFVTSAFVINPPMVDDATVDETATAVVTDDGEARIRVDFEAENDRTPGTLTLTFQTVADANGDPVTTTGSTRP